MDDYNLAIKADSKHTAAYLNRALLRKSAGDLDGALEDLNRAAELNPKSSVILANRGNTKRAKGDFAGALADYNRALELNPRSVPTYYSRAILKVTQGDSEGALADFKKCDELAKNELKDYAQIQMWLIRTRTGAKETANQELAACLDHRAGGASGEWTARIESFLLGRISEPDFTAAAASPDGRKERGQQCEMWYYAGMKQLLTGDKKAAAEDFRKSVGTGEKSFTEYDLAQFELKTIAK